MGAEAITVSLQVILRIAGQCCSGFIPLPSEWSETPGRFRRPFKDALKLQPPGPKHPTRTRAIWLWVKTRLAPVNIPIPKWYHWF